MIEITHKSRRGFPEEFCKEIVSRYRAGESIPALCAEIPVSRSTLYRWISLYTEFRRNSGKTVTLRDINHLIEENRMLRKKIRYSATAAAIHPIP